MSIFNRKTISRREALKFLGGGAASIFLLGNCGSDLVESINTLSPDQKLKVIQFKADIETLLVLFELQSKQNAPISSRQVESMSGRISFDEILQNFYGAFKEYALGAFQRFEIVEDEIIEPLQKFLFNQDQIIWQQAHYQYPKKKTSKFLIIQGIKDSRHIELLDRLNQLIGKTGKNYPTALRKYAYLIQLLKNESEKIKQDRKLQLIVRSINNNLDQGVSNGNISNMISVANLLRSFLRDQMDLVFPVPGGILTSGYGSRTNPHGRGYQWHPGIDIAANLGTSVFSPVEGEVMMAGFDTNGYGNQVLVRKTLKTGVHDTVFGHLHQVNVKQGDCITAGTCIGLVGSTGDSTAPHLHYEIRSGGSPLALVTQTPRIFYQNIFQQWAESLKELDDNRWD